MFTLFEGTKRAILKIAANRLSLVLTASHGVSAVEKEALHVHQCPLSGLYQVLQVENQ